MKFTARNIANYQSQESLENLVEDLNLRLSEKQKIQLLEIVMENGIMIRPFFLKAIKFLRPNTYRQRTIMFFNRYPQYRDMFWTDTMGHIMGGHDLVDPKSAGGLNDAEMALFTSFLEQVGYTPNNNLVITALKNNWFVSTTSIQEKEALEAFELA